MTRILSALLLLLILLPGLAHAKQKKQKNQYPAWVDAEISKLKPLTLFQPNTSKPVAAPVAVTEPTPCTKELGWRDKVLASVLVLEAGGDGVRGMEAVLHVIHNRRLATGTDPYTVITRRRQFSTMFNGPDYAYRKARKSTAYDDAEELVRKYNRGELGPDFTLGSTLFESFKHKPVWAKKSIVTLRIGNNTFYRARA